MMLNIFHVITIAACLHYACNGAKTTDSAENFWSTFKRAAMKQADEMQNDQSRKLSPEQEQQYRQMLEKQISEKIRILAWEDQNADSVELTPVKVSKIHHDTNPEDAGNGRQKANLIRPRDGDRAVANLPNQSEEDVLNKIYKNN